MEVWMNSFNVDLMIDNFMEYNEKPSMDTEISIQIKFNKNMRKSFPGIHVTALFALVLG